MNWPILHSGEGYPTGWMHASWLIDPMVLLSVFGITAAYFLYTGALNRKRSDASERTVSWQKRAAFLTGSLAFLIALGPPLDSWSDNYLLSAHMAQHMILMYVVAPLWLYGIPAWLLEPLTKRPRINRAGFAITRPVPAIVVSSAIIIFWHFPGVYDMALRSEPVHLVQHASFFIAALLAWWPVLGPLPAWPKLTEPLQCLYLFLVSLPTGLVGAFITFAGVPLYHFYGSSPRIFGISLEVDQQLGGLMMWVGGSTIYFLWISNIFLRWGRREEEAERGSLTIPPTSPGPTHAHSP